MWCLLLLQHQLALLANDTLGRMSEPRMEPRQYAFESHVCLVHVDKTASPLTERRHAETETVARPDLFFQRQHPGEFSLGTAEAIFDASQRLVLTEPVRDYDDERFRHYGSVS